MEETRAITVERFAELVAAIPSVDYDAICEKIAALPRNLNNILDHYGAFEINPAAKKWKPTARAEWFRKIIRREIDYAGATAAPDKSKTKQTGKAKSGKEKSGKEKSGKAKSGKAKSEVVTEIPAEVAATEPAEIRQFMTVFRNLEDKLRGASYLVGDEALDVLANFLAWRLVSPLIESGAIDALNIEKWMYAGGPARGVITRDNIKYAIMRNHVDVPQFSSWIERMDKCVFHTHPVLKLVFSERIMNDKLRTNPEVLSDMIKYLCAIDFEANRDYLAAAYQHFAHARFRGGAGSTLGQHFTPPEIIGAVSQLVAPLVHSCKNAQGSFCDPFAGTGGFLLEMLQIARGAAAIAPGAASASTAAEAAVATPAELITRFFGTEISPVAHRFALINLLVATGTIAGGVRLGDAFDNLAAKSALEKREHKYDTIMTNPPFGVKLAHDYEQFGKIHNGNVACLAHCMNILAPGGTCGMIWPHGAEAWGRDIAKTRTRLFENFTVVGIIEIPHNTFEYTGVATVALIFRAVAPAPGAAVQFYAYKGGAIAATRCVPLEQMKAAEYRIKADQYAEKLTLVVPAGFEKKRLGDICEIASGKFQSNEMNNKGNIPFYNCSANNPVGTHDAASFDFLDYLLIITAGGSRENPDGDDVGLGKLFRVHGPTACRAGVRALYNIKIDVNYLCHYLKINRLAISAITKFLTSLGTITSSDLANLEILVPPIEAQREISARMDILAAGIERLRAQLTAAEGETGAEISGVATAATGAESARIFNASLPCRAPRRKLGDICAFAGKGGHPASYGKETGAFPFFRSSMVVDCFVDKPDFTTESIIIGCGGKPNVNYCREFSASADCYILQNVTDVQLKYVYYCLVHQLDKLEKSFSGLAIKHISKQSIGDFEIPIPSLEEQRDLITLAEEFAARQESARRSIAQMKTQQTKIFNEFLNSSAP